MHKMPPTVPISNLRNDQDKILQMMDEEPVMLTQRGKARATLVSIEQWNYLMDRLEMYRAYWRAESERIQNDMSDQDWLDAEPMLEKWAAKHGVGANVSVPVE